MADNPSGQGRLSHLWSAQFLHINWRGLPPQAKVNLSAVVVGLVAGLGAVAFSTACEVTVRYTLEQFAGYHPAVPAGEVKLSWLPLSTQDFLPWMLLLVPTLGGVLCGVLVYTLAPEAEGHGTDSVIAAYHQHQGQMRVRVPLVKIVASAITLGTGGSGGREGPIAQIGAGFGSLLANLLGLRPSSRRILLAAGMGAGIAAIFRAPLAGALFAAEVLYSSPEFEPEVIIPAGIASVVSYCTFGAILGWQPLFIMPLFQFQSPLELAAYLLLVIFMVVLASLYVRTFYGITHLFRKLPVWRHLRPAIGAFLTGLIGLLLYFIFGSSVLSVLSFGYGILQQSLTSMAGYSAALLLAVALGKLLTTSLTIGSGGSGGVFGPSMVIGGCAGGALGLFLHDLSPSLVPNPASFVIVGMAAFFAAAAKTPFSTLVIVCEMTQNYSLLLPALWVCMIAFLISDRRSIYSEQCPSRFRSPAHRGKYVGEVLAAMQVAQFMEKDGQVPALNFQDPPAAVLSRFKECSHLVLPVTDSDHKFAGVVFLEDLNQIMAANPHASQVAADFMRTDVRPLYPDDPLDRVEELFMENDLPALPILERGTRQVIGIFRQTDIAAAYLKHVHEGTQPPA